MIMESINEIENNENEHETSVTTDEEKRKELITPISNAFTLSLEKKCAKISNFMKQHDEDFEANLQHLIGFALSSGGLIKDEYRKRIWPILVKNIPPAEKYSITPTQPHFPSSESIFASGKYFDEEDADSNVSNISDSDFESALSNLSSSALAGDAEEPLIDDDDAITTNSSPTPEISLEELQSHNEWRQVELDVNRTLARFPPNIDDEKRAQLQDQLTKMIVQLLYENPKFHYYQGFHDVCLTFLLVLDSRITLHVLRDLCHRGSFYNYLSCTLEESVLRELDDLYLLLYLHDHEIERIMRDVELGTLFALSWPLTWFSHALQSYSQVVLFFDFFLCSHHLMPIYVSAALIHERKEDILSCEQEMPALHKLLNEVSDNLNFHRILNTARFLFGRYPPTLLKELKKEYLQICERQRRQRSAIQNLELTKIRNAREHLLRRENGTLRQNVYEFVKPFAFASGVAALAFAYYFVQKNTVFS